MIYPADVREQMRVRYAATLSTPEVAREFGCSPTTVNTVLRESGIMLRGHPGGRRRPRSMARTSNSGGRVNSAGYVIWWFWWWEGGERRTQEIAEHRVLMERCLGRPLTSSEEVHHRNGQRGDNRIENLELRVRPHGSGATHCSHCGAALSEVIA